MITLLTNLTLLLALAGLAATPAAIVFWRRWHQAETAARANGQRADLEQLERERAEWQFKQERAQLVALDERRQREVARLCWLVFLMIQAAPEAIYLIGYRQAVADHLEVAQAAERELGA